MNGNTGVLADMEELGIWEPVSVKEQTYKTAIEVSQVVLGAIPCQCALCCADSCAVIAHR